MSRARLFFGMALVILVTILVFPISMTHASPLAQSDDLCAGILPAGATQQGKSSTRCTGVIDGFTIDIGYWTFIESAKADLQTWRDFWVNNFSLKPINIGDEGVSVAQQGYISSVYWRYGCYVVWSTWPETKDPVFNAGGKTPDFSEYQRNETRLLALSREVETNLKQLPPCRDSSAPSTQPPAPPPDILTEIPNLPTALGVVLSCQTNNPDPGLVTCSAQATGAPADVIITYQWTVDNRVQTVTGNLLRLKGVQPGAHVVEVIAQDTLNSQNSSPQSVSFTKSASVPGSSPSSSSSGGFNPLGPILVLLGGGILLGAGGLVAGKILTGRGATTAKAGMPSKGLSGTTLTGAMFPKPPGTLPEIPLGSTLVKPGTRPGTLPERINTAASLPKRQTTLPEELGSVRTSLSPTEKLKPNIAPTVRQKRNETEEYRFVPDAPVIKVKGNGQTRVPVNVRVVKYKGAIPSDASGEVQCNVNCSHPDKISIGPLSSKVHFEVWARHLGSQAFTDGYVTVSGTTQTGKSLPDLRLPVEVEPVELTVHLTAWKQGFLCQEVTETLSRACAFVDGFVGVSKNEIANKSIADSFSGFPNYVENLPSAPSGSQALLRGNLTPIAYSRVQASLRIGDGAFSELREEVTGSDGKFRFAMPYSLISTFGGSGIAEELMQPTELFLHSDVIQELNRLRADSRELPAQSIYNTARQECSEYRSQFFDQLCAQPGEQFDSLMGSLILLRTSLVFARRYRQDFIDQKPAVRQAAQDSFGAVLYLIIFTSGLMNATIDKLGTWGARNVMEWAAWLVERRWGRWLLSPILRSMNYLATAALRTCAWLAEKATQAFQRMGVIRRLPANYDLYIKQAQRKLALQVLRERQLAGKSPDQQMAKEVWDSLSNPMIEALAFWYWFKVNLIMLPLASLVAYGCRYAGIAIIQVSKLLGSTGMTKTRGKLRDKTLNWIGNKIDKQVWEWGQRMNASGGQDVATFDAVNLVVESLTPLEEMDQGVANSLHAAYIRSVQRSIPDNWRERPRWAIRVQVEFLNSWQGVAEYTLFVETVNAVYQFVMKYVVQALYFSLSLLAQKLTTCLGKIASVMQRESIQNYNTEMSNQYAEVGSLASKLADIAEAVVNVRILVTECTRLVNIQHGLPEMIAFLYDTGAEEMAGEDTLPEPEEEPMDPGASSGSETAPAFSSPVTAGMGGGGLLSSIASFFGSKTPTPEEKEKTRTQEANAYAQEVAKNMADKGVRLTDEQIRLLVEERRRTLKEAEEGYSGADSSTGEPPELGTALQRPTEQ